MPTQRPALRFWTVGIAALVFAVAAWLPGRADDPPAAAADNDKDAPAAKPNPPKFEVHEWSVWAADPTVQMVNANDHYPNTLPGVVESSRSRRAGKDQKRLSPLSVVTFHGEKVPDLEVDLRVQVGRFVAHWPPAQPKTGRVRWLDRSLLAEPDAASRLTPITGEHWFLKARESKALFVRAASRSERFLAYDVEMNFKIPIEVKGGPDKYQIVNVSNATLYDVVVSLPTPQGRRIGWLDVLPAGQPAKAAQPAPSKPAAAAKSAANKAKAAEEAARAAALAAAPAAAPAPAPAAGAATSTTKAKSTPAKASQPAAPSSLSSAPVDLVMSAPLAADSPQLAELTRKALTERSLKAGLNAEEAELLASAYAESMLQSPAMTVAVRLPSGFIEEKLPLTVYPDPAKTVRVGWLVLGNMDPQIGNDIKDLVVKLGDAKYSVREAAATRLSELGPLAYPALKEGLKNTDMEIVSRAESILLSQNQSIDTPAAAAGGAVGGIIQKVLGR